MSARLQHTTEFTRIRDLPRRVISEEIAREYAELLTPVCRRAGATVELRPWQAYSLAEARANGGAFLGLPVGIGKTLIAEMLPVVLESKRPVLLAPANLRRKTRGDRTQLAKDGWALASPPPRFVSFHDLALKTGADLLDSLEPDLVIIDESDALANLGAAAPTRIDRYVVGNRENVVVVAMSGTPVRKSIMNYWHIMHWCLPNGCPLPAREGEARAWGFAIDDHRGRRPHPGPLGSNLNAARRWFFRRVVETPGVVVVDGDSCKAPLHVRVRIAKECKITDGHYETFLKHSRNPRGIDTSNPLTRYQTDAPLGSGLCLYWDPPPPDPWMAARRAFNQFVRRAVEDSQRTSNPIETMEQVRSRFRTHPVVEKWREVSPTFKPKTKVEWLSTAALESVEEWLAEEEAPGIVWVGTPAFGVRLAKRTGLHFYRAQGQNELKQDLYDADPRKSLIASWNANKRGHNLQAWGRALMCQPPTSAKYLEQTVGRQHRSGREEAVRLFILATSGGTLDAFEAAIGEARFAKSNMGLTQKILRADITREKPTKTATNRYRWARAR